MSHVSPSCAHHGERSCAGPLMLHPHYTRILLSSDAEAATCVPCAGPLQHGRLKLTTYNTHGRTPLGTPAPATTGPTHDASTAASTPRHANKQKGMRV